MTAAASIILCATSDHSQTDFQHSAMCQACHRAAAMITRASGVLISLFRGSPAPALPLDERTWAGQLVAALWPYYAVVAIGLAVLGVRKCWGG